MKKTFFIVVLMISSYTMVAQTEPAKEAEVKAMENIEVQALLQKDTQALKKIWSCDFAVNSPLNSVFVGGQIEMVKNGTISYSSFTRNIEKVFVWKDVVITMGNETLVPTGSAPMAGQTVNRRYTNIWTKENGNWILIARHANVICEPAKTSTSALLDADDLVPSDPGAAAQSSNAVKKRN